MRWLLAKDGKQLAVGLADNSVRLFDIVMGKEVRSLTGHKGAVHALVYTTKGDQLVSGSADKTVQVWDLASGQSKLTLASWGRWCKRWPWPRMAGCSAAAMTRPSKSGRYARGQGRGHSADGSRDSWAYRISSDSQRLATASGDGSARVFDIDGKLREFFPHQGPVSAVVFHPDGKRVITASADKSARRLDAGFALACRAMVRRCVRAFISPAGDRVLVRWR